MQQITITSTSIETSIDLLYDIVKNQIIDHMMSIKRTIEFEENDLTNMHSDDTCQITAIRYDPTLVEPILITYTNDVDDEADVDLNVGWLLIQDLLVVLKQIEKHVNEIS